MESAENVKAGGRRYRCCARGLLSETQTCKGSHPVRCDENEDEDDKSQNSVHVKLSKGLIRGCIGVSQPPQVIRPLQALLDLVLVFHSQAKLE